MRNSSMGPLWKIDPRTHHTMSERSYHRATSCPPTSYKYTHSLISVTKYILHTVYTYSIIVFFIISLSVCTSILETHSIIVFLIISCSPFLFLPLSTSLFSVHPPPPTRHFLLSSLSSSISFPSLFLYYFLSSFRLPLTCSRLRASLVLPVYTRTSRLLRLSITAGDTLRSTASTLRGSFASESPR